MSMRPRFATTMHCNTYMSYARRLLHAPSDREALDVPADVSHDDIRAFRERYKHLARILHYDRAPYRMRSLSQSVFVCLQRRFQSLQRDSRAGGFCPQAHGLELRSPDTPQLYYYPGYPVPWEAPCAPPQSALEGRQRFDVEYPMQYFVAKERHFLSIRDVVARRNAEFAHALAAARTTHQRTDDLLFRRSEIECWRLRRKLDIANARLPVRLRHTHDVALLPPAPANDVLAEALSPEKATPPPRKRPRDPADDAEFEGVEPRNPPSARRHRTMAPPPSSRALCAP